MDESQERYYRVLGYCKKRPLRNSGGRGMSGFELTPAELENWRKHSTHSKKLSDSLRGNPKLRSRTTDKKVVQKVIELYKTYGVNFISSELSMSVDTVKQILREAGVYE
jgi:hypothetical protein